METYEEIFSRMKEAYEKESGCDPEDVSDTGLRMKVLAGEVYRLEKKLDWIRQQAFLQTATGEQLDSHGALRGVARRGAAHATGTITFSRYLPLSFDLVIPAGTVCATSGSSPLEYETLEQAILSAGSLNVAVPTQAVQSGAAGNVASGRINTLSSSLTGINTVTNKTPFSGGREQESDGEYRSRVLLAYQNLPNGTNAAYYRDIALSCPGVGSAGVVPKKDGANTVGVYIWGEAGAPDTATISRLKAEYDRLREVGVTVSVQAAAQSAVNVGLRMKLPDGMDFGHGKELAESAIAAYFAGLSVGSPVYLAEIERAVLNAVPAVKLAFFSSMRDVNGAANTLLTLGTVTLEESV